MTCPLKSEPPDKCRMAVDLKQRLNLPQSRIQAFVKREGLVRVWKYLQPPDELEKLECGPECPMEATRL